MRSNLLSPLLICLFCSCVSTKGLHIGFAKKQDITVKASNAEFSTVMDFQVQRLSGSRVRISWHALRGSKNPVFEILKRTGKNGKLQPVDMVEASNDLPDTIYDYAITDFNQSKDSSFYAIRQIDEKGTKYNSMWKGVRGVE